MLKSNTLVQSLAGFAEYARKKGLVLSPAEVADGAGAVSALAPLSLPEMKEVLEPCLVKCVADRDVYERAFDEYFRIAREEVPAIIAVARSENNLRGRRTGRKGVLTKERPEAEKGPENAAESGPKEGWRAAFGKDPSLSEPFKLFLSGEKYAAAARLAKNPLTDSEKREIVVAVSRLAAQGIISKADLPEVAAEIERYAALASEVEKMRSSFSKEDRQSVRKGVHTAHGGAHAWSSAADWLFDISPEVLAQQLEKVDKNRLALLIKEAERAAAALKPLIAKAPGSLGRKKALDYRKTLRASLSTFGEPFRLCCTAKRRRLRRVVTVCDVSGSVKNVTGILLAFLYGLHQAFEGRVRHFVFVSEIDEVTPYFSLDSYEECFDKVTRAAAVDYRGYSNYGKMLELLWDRHRSAFDHETLVIFLGDARTNRYDPKGWIVKEISSLVRKAFFLNPEDPSEWYSGDSAVATYEKAVEFVNVSRFGGLVEFLRKLPGLVVA
ncbi:MAG: VWA domain-containing protein [Desulfotomaculales bacterium]